MIKKWGLCLLGLFVGFCCVRLDHTFHRRPHPLASLVQAQPYASEWDTAPLSAEAQQEITQILNQPFTYYDKGSQAYVFLSADGKYVIKFLKQHLFRPNSWLCHLPFPYNPYYHKYRNRKNKFRSAYRAWKIAFTDLKEETAVVYLHLNPSEHVHGKVTFFDKRGHRKQLDLDKSCFLIQKKADLVFPRLTELMAQKEIEKAKLLITSVFSLLDTLGKKGVVDNDPRIRKNFGFVSDEAVQIDVGMMKIDPDSASLYRKEITAPLGAWLGENHPELLAHFQDCVQHF